MNNGPEKDAFATRVAECGRIIIEAYDRGRYLLFVDDKSGVWTAKSRSDPADKDDTSGTKLCQLHSSKVIVVGIDIREYSRRSPEEQFFLTLIIHANITRAIRKLRDGGMLSLGEPRVVVQTGDGALVVFSCVDRKAKGGGRTAHDDLEDLSLLASMAFDFTFAMNALMQGENARQGITFKRADKEEECARVFPIYLRFSMSYDTVHFMTDVNGCLNCVGQGMVSCHRILSSDHGNHFLVSEELIRCLGPLGGVNAVGSGKWGQRLHYTMLQETKVKSAYFRYADVFGFHLDAPLLAVVGRHHAVPEQFHIGSHDVGSLDK